MSEIKLLVNGLEFAGWKRARITFGCDAIAGSFDLSVSDRWSGDGDDGVQAWPIHEEDECKIVVNGQTLIDGWVDKRSLSYGPEERSLSVSGRDRAGILVDCSALLKSFSFKDLSILDVAQRLCEPFGISVSLDPSVSPKMITLTAKKHAGSVTGAGSSGKRTGLKTPKAPKKFVLDPGDTAFNALDKACRIAALVPISDQAGGIILTRTGSARAQVDLIEGGNILSASAEFNAATRYRRYIVRGQHPGADDFFGKPAASVSAEATDVMVSRLDRVLVIRPESAVTAESAQSRAAWEAKTRAARSNEVTVVVAGWTQGDGLPLWPINALVNITSPAIGVRGQMLITEVRLSIDDSAGELAELTLRLPDAFLPEPTVTEASFAWKEIARGVK